MLTRRTDRSQQTQASGTRYAGVYCAAILVISAMLTLPAWGQVQNDEIGFSSTHVFDGSLKGESIDVMTGNLNLTFPIGPRYPLGDDFGYQVRLYYNSKLWEHDCEPGVTCVGTLKASDTYGLGFSIHFGRIYQHPDDRDDVYRYQSPDGAEHFFEYDPGKPDLRGVSHDASMIWVEQTVEGWEVYPGDGTRVILNRYVDVIASDEELANNGWYATRIETIREDSLGEPQHFVDIVYSDTVPLSQSITNNRIQYIRDSALREIDFDYSTSFVVRIHLPAFSGVTSAYDSTETAVYELVTSQVTDNVSDPAPYAGEVTRAYLTELRPLALTSGEKYVFTYRPNGQIETWSLPTGALVTYYYKAYFSGLRKPHHSEMVMKVLRSQDVDYRWSYTRFGDGLLRDHDDLAAYTAGTSFNSSNASKVKVLDPFDNLTIYRFHHTIFGSSNCDSMYGECTGSWDDGLLYEVNRYAGPAEDGSRLVDQERLTYTKDPSVLTFRDALSSGSPYDLPRNIRLATREVVQPGGGTLPATHVKEVCSDWAEVDGYQDSGTGEWVITRHDSRPRLVIEYVNQYPHRTTYTAWGNVDSSHNVHSYIEAKNASGEVIARVDRRFYGSRVACEIQDGTGAANDTINDCDVGSLVEAGDLAFKKVFDSDTGNVTSKITYGGDDLVSHTVTFGHDTDSLLLTSKQYSGLAWKALDRDRDFNTGLPSVSRGPDGAEISYSWDGLGRLLQITPTLPEAPTVITYPTIHETRVTQHIDTDTYTESIYHYDDLGRLVKEERRNLLGEYDFRLIEYDIAGNVVKASEWARPGTVYPAMAWTTTEYKFRNTAYIDPLGRASTVIGPGGETVETDHLGRVTTITRYGITGAGGAEISSSTTYVNDELGRLVEVDSPDGGADAAYEYDDLDNLTKVTLTDPTDPAKQQIRSFSYDHLGRLRFATNPESGTTEYVAYDARGNLLEYVDSRLNRFTNQYDAAGRLTAKKVKVGANDVPLIEKVYDETSTAFYGKLTTSRSYRLDGTASVLVAERSFQYGPVTAGGAAVCYSDGEGTNYEGLNGRLSRTVTSLAGFGDPVSSLSTSRCYNATGAQARLVYPFWTGSDPDPSQVGYLFHNGHLWEVHDSNADRSLQYIEDVAYGPGGVPTQVTRGNGVIESMPKDAQGRPVEFQVLLPIAGTSDPELTEVPGCSGGTGLQHIQFCGSNYDPGSTDVLWDSGGYGYDGAGNIETIGADSYRYDALNRLEYASINHDAVNYTLSYDYDVFGNMTQRLKTASTVPTDDLRTYAVDWQTNRLTGQSRTYTLGTDTFAYEYDAGGNMITAGDRGYQFDAMNRLGRVTDISEGVVAEYDYDANGNRVRSVVDGIETFYFRDESGRILSEFRRGAGETYLTPEWDKDYVYALGHAIAFSKNDNPRRVARPWAVNVSTQGLTVHWAKVEEPDMKAYVLEKTYKQNWDSTPVIEEFDLTGAQLSWTDSFGGGYIKNDTELTYRVRAVDNAMNHGDWSSPLLVRPKEGVPDEPTGLIAEPSDRTIRLTWAANPFDSDLVGYIIELEGPTDTWTALNSTPIPGTVYWHTGLENDVWYNYRVIAVDTAEQLSDPSTASGARPLDSLPPVRPYGVVARAGKEAETVELSWDPVYDDNLAGYRVYRNGNQVGDDLADTETTLSESSVTQGSEHCYTVEAFDGWGNVSSASDTSCVWPRRNDISPPEITSVVFDIDDGGTASLDGVPGSGDENNCDYGSEDDDVIQVRVTWDEATSTRYRIYRSDGVKIDFRPVYDFDSSLAQDECFAGECWHLDPIPAGHEFSYYVVALETVGGTDQESATHPVGADPELSVSGDVLGALPSVRNLNAWDGDDAGFVAYNAESRSVRLEWSRVPDPRVVGYHVYRKCDLFQCQPGSLTWGGKVQQHESCVNAWQRLTWYPVTAERVYEDRALGGLQGCFLYAVRPITADQEEGPMTKALSVSVPNNADHGNPYCEADEDTFDSEDSRYPSWSVVATQTELSRVNSATRGATPEDGLPQPPLELNHSYVDMPQEVLYGDCDPADEGYDRDRIICGTGYVLGMRRTRAAKLTWDFDEIVDGQYYSVEPSSDLVGFHIEVAGSAQGPWRRVTGHPIAWWERTYHHLDVGVRRFDAQTLPGTSYYANDQFSGNLDCRHYRLIAIDEDGNESAPVEFDYVPDPRTAVNCPTGPTLEAPTGLVASTGTPTTDCTTRLEWNRVDDAVEYVIYRYVFPGGLFFYPTQVQAATAEAVQVYDEHGDGDYYPVATNVNNDCPTANGWHNGFGNSGIKSCETGWLDAFYVTAIDIYGAESPRSEIVFWECDQDPGYVRLLPTAEEEQLILLAEAGVPGAGELMASLQSLNGGLGSAIDDQFAVCEISKDLGGPGVLDEEADWSPATAPLLTLAGAGDVTFGIFAMHVDHLGSTRLVTDMDGDVVSEHEFFPFGEEILPTRDFSTKIFTGHERDRETGLDYMLARYYGTSLPRFLSPDPLGGNTADPQSWNRFAYVRNNPVNLVDPLGMFWAPGTAPPDIESWGNPRDVPCYVCKEKEPTDSDREDAVHVEGTETKFTEGDPDAPGWDYAYNCNSMVFHYGKGDPTDSRNDDAPPGWDRYGNDDLANKTRLDPEEPNAFHDIVAYGRDTDQNGELDLSEVEHVGLVIGVDSEGNTTKVIGKFGDDAIHIHHPAAREVEGLYGTMRAYFRF